MCKAGSSNASPGRPLFLKKEIRSCRNAKHVISLRGEPHASVLSLYLRDGSYQGVVRRRNGTPEARALIRSICGPPGTASPDREQSVARWIVLVQFPGDRRDGSCQGTASSPAVTS